MTETDQSSPRRTALTAALEVLPELTPKPPVAVLPITATQWEQSIRDANLDAHATEYASSRLEITSALSCDGSALGRVLRPASLRFATAARDFCDCLEILSALDPGKDEAPGVASSWRALITQDAHAILAAAVDNTGAPSMPPWPSLPSVTGNDERDVLLATFGIPADDLVDDAGAFCDSRVIALHRLRLSELQQTCDQIMALVCEHPPSVFTAVSAVRDLATSTSPWVTLWGARDIRSRIVDAFGADSRRTGAVLAEAAQEGDKEWAAFMRLRECLRRAEAAQGNAAGTERDRAVAILEAYRHMAEGIVRRWLRTLLSLAGLEDPPRTIGALGQPAVAWLGELGSRVGAALVPAMRNAEAHDDFTFDEDTGMLVLGEAAFHPDEIDARLTDLDVLQRALIVGRLAAFADRPGLAGNAPASLTGSSASSAMSFARLRFGHAGQRVRSFVRDRDRLDIVIDNIRPDACNPCFVALTQTAQVLPTVSRFTVRVSDREEPVIDLPNSVLHENWSVFMLAAQYFPDGLPQVTFLPCLAWIRLACEPVEEAGKVAAWMALNDAQHAILDAEAAPTEALRLPRRFGVGIAAATSTIRVLPEGPHFEDLIRARRIMLATANAFARDPYGVATSVLMDRILGLRDRLGGPPAVLPTLDPTPLRKGSYPHTVS